MKNISLLPPEIREEKKKRENYRYYLLTGFAVLAIFLIFSVNLLVMTVNTNSKAASLEWQRREIENRMSELEKYAAMQKRAQEAEILLRGAMGDIPEWDRLLQELSLSIPGDVWLSELNATFADGSGEIHIRGWSSRHDSMATWLPGVENIDGINDIRCHYSEENTLDGKPVIQFEIRGNLEPGEPFDRLLKGGFF